MLGCFVLFPTLKVSEKNRTCVCTAATSGENNVVVGGLTIERFWQIIFLRKVFEGIPVEYDPFS